jgi:hypothetical protein
MHNAARVACATFVGSPIAAYTPTVVDLLPTQRPFVNPDFRSAAVCSDGLRIHGSAQEGQ